MILKDLIKKLERFDENSDVWVKFNYNDTDEGYCEYSFNQFNFKTTKSWTNKPILNISEWVLR